MTWFCGHDFVAIKTATIKTAGNIKKKINTNTGQATADFAERFIVLMLHLAEMSSRLFRLSDISDYCPQEI